MTLTQVTTGGVDENINIDNNTLKVDGTNNRVGINYASPQSALDISGAISFRPVSLPSAGVSRIYQRDTDNSLYLQTSSGNKIHFLDNFQNSYASFAPTVLKFNISNNEQLRLDSSGNLNLVSPTSTITDGNNLNFTASDLSVYARVQGGKSGSGVGDLRFYTYSGGLAERARIDSSGRLLLNTTTEGDSSADDLTVENSTNCGITIRSGSTYYGSLYFSDATSGTGEYEGYVQYNHSSRFLTFGVASQTRMQIDSSGNVGINTLSPSSKLHVNGTITDSIGPIRRLGITAVSATGNLSANDAGKLLRSTATITLTIPSGTFTAGDMITIFNASSGDNTIAQGSGVTLYNTADAATGNRTLAAKGVCTIACTSTNEFIISGSGLS